MYMFEAVQFIEYVGKADPEETLLGTYHIEGDALTVARRARQEFIASENKAYAWWVVRVQGAKLANFIADSRSEKEFMVDLRTGELIEISRP
jgi:hypothetical protein